MHIHRRRHDDPLPGKVIRSVIFLGSALVFALALAGFFRDASAQWQYGGFSLDDGAGGRDYFFRQPGADSQMMQFGTEALRMGHQADMQRRALNARHGSYQHPQYDHHMIEEPNVNYGYPY